MASLLYGAVLRLHECVGLRVKDLDIGAARIVVRRGKGNKDRVTMLPQTLVTPLETHLQEVRAQHDSDLASGAGYLALPEALGTKYPNAAREWPWQWVFPATRTYLRAATGERRRHHLHETVLRHSFATHLLESGYDIRTIPEAPWHSCRLRDEAGDPQGAPRPSDSTDAETAASFSVSWPVSGLDER